VPVYEVIIGTLYIQAKNEKSAKLGACNYVATDLGIECILATKLKGKQVYDWKAWFATLYIGAKHLYR